MAKVEVFNYRWEYWDFIKDEHHTKVSEGKFTEAYVKEKAEQNPSHKHQVIRETKELVDESLVVDGAYQPVSPSIS